jgi:hypothetical protein
MIKKINILSNIYLRRMLILVIIFSYKYFIKMSNEKSLSYGENSLAGSKANTIGIISRPKCTNQIYVSLKCWKVKHTG